MDEVIKQLVLQVPALIVLVWLMTLVFKYIAGRDRFIQELHKDDAEARAASRQVISENTKVVGESIEVMRNVAAAVRGCQYARDRLPPQDKPEM
jgi:hypothetical protein